MPLTDWHEDHLVPFSTVNVTTCAAYVVAGVATVRAGVLHVGGALIVLGLASAVYHATRSMWGDRLDYGGMLAVFGLLVLDATGAPLPLALGVSLALAGLPWLEFVWDRREQLVGLLAGLALGTLAATPTAFAVALLALAVGYAAWILDVEWRFPFPRWGHGVWHVATAAALWWIAVQ